jgi:hypothetical protein
MDIHDLTTRQGPDRDARSGCLVDGCPCQDARIVSHRRAKFFAHLAVIHGETADRVVRPEPGWEIPRAPFDRGEHADHPTIWPGPHSSTVWPGPDGVFRAYPDKPVD